MSKAFTKENDDAPEPAVARRPPPTLPPGVRNHVTPESALRWREELERLTEVERPRLASAESTEERLRLSAVDDEIHRLRHCLRSAVETPPPPVGEDRARFGAWVVVRESSGEDSRYRIVGVYEADPERGWISWLSPLAKALLNLRAGEFARLRTPGGESRLEVRSVDFLRPAGEF